MLTVLAAFALEALAQPALPGFIVGYEVARNGNSMREQIPAGETVQKWTRMITMQRFAGVGRKADGNAFLQLMIDGLQRGCPGAKVIYRRASERIGQVRVDCPLNPETSLPETFFAKALPGAADMHIAQVAFRRVPTPADVAWAEHYLASVKLKP